MKDAVSAIFPAFSQRYEGKIDHMYLDVKGLVTTGIGNLIDPLSAALACPFVKPNGESALPSEIENEWRLVKSMQSFAKVGHRAFKDVTHLRLDDEGIAQLVEHRMGQNEAVLSKRFANWADLPASAQLAVHSMAWAMGPAFRFPKFAAALGICDWATCAEECKMNEAGNPGLVPRNLANKRLFQACEAGVDAETVAWP